jgi:phospholipid/cholesterol/gamma-HCH transport system substrate-binding protein
MERTAVRPAPIRHLRLKAWLLGLIAPVAIVALAVYALHARGVFEPSRHIYLQTRDAEGIDSGTPVTLSGFSLGRVRSMALTDDGAVRIEIVLRERDAHWLQQSSVFTLVRPLVGAARIEVANPVASGTSLPPGAVRPLSSGDPIANLPAIAARVEAVLRQTEALTAAEGSLARSLANLETVTARMAGPGGAMAAVTGDPATGPRLARSIDDLQALGASLGRVSARIDRVIADADRKILGRDGTADEAHKAMVQLTGVLTDLRATTEKLDMVLENAKAASADLKTLSAGAKDAGGDLAALRRQVDDSVRRADDLLREMNRKWPFARSGTDAKARLP